MSEASPSSAENRFATSAWLFLRLLALVHLVAFVSFWVQLPGLVGPRGLLPATPYFAAIREHYGTAAYAQLPTLCWLFGSETFLHVLCGAGVALSFLLFAVGVTGVLIRRNLLTVLMSIELILNAANLNLIAFSRQLGDLNGQLFAVFVITLAAGEAAIGLAIIISMYRLKGSVNLDDAAELKG